MCVVVVVVGWGRTPVFRAIFTEQSSISSLHIHLHPLAAPHHRHRHSSSIVRSCFTA